MNPTEWIVWWDGFEWGIASGCIIGIAAGTLLARLYRWTSWSKNLLDDPGKEPRL